MSTGHILVRKNFICIRSGRLATTKRLFSDLLLSTARSFRFLPLEGEDPCFASDKLQRSKTWRRGSDVRDLGFTGRLNEHMMAEESWSSTTAEKSRLQHG
ncbi:hypothetical protein HPB47_006506 [Ixodes persulcatus]|uniref:Uncharacterized protein n=1 Tax=Ixodes persulcatus TaxID=34615 RepID=A0AC60PA35_IXOPE|nr:hypothetical protein HPB47_006506 [Ixodes persulcatus]